MLNLLEAQLLSLHASPGLVPEASSPIKNAWELWNPPHLPRGMLGDKSGDICPTRGAVPGRPCPCCPLGKGLLVCVRARGWQVGLGCSWWREAQGEDPRDQRSGGVSGLLAQLPCGRK